MASEVGLAKSSLLRYFESREEIYLQITADCWHDWSHAAREGLSQSGYGADRVADVLTQTLSERPLFCDLLAHTQANLEHNVSSEAVRALRTGASVAIDELSAAILICLPALDGAAAADIVLLTSMIAGAVWQRANPPAALALSYRHDPHLRSTCLDFDPSMQVVLRTLIQGTISAELERVLTYLPPTRSPRRSKQRAAPVRRP